MIESSLPYWMALTHARSFITGRKLEFLIESVHEKDSLESALKKVANGDRLGFDFTDKEWDSLQTELKDLPNYSFLAEELESKGITCINIMDKFVYPKTLKINLKKRAPILIYAKGNLDLIKKNAIAIVGARKSKQRSLDFTDTIAKKSVKDGSVVVSGFAKGIDKKALDSALEHGGKSIIVLPQGIDTYTSKAYYKYITKGDVLVFSTYHPKAAWSVGLAMDRNKTIYGLANEIYVAESNDSGGTWEGVLDGLKRGRIVYVRYPEPREKNANMQLLERGATPVDQEGKEVATYQPMLVQEPGTKYSRTSDKIDTPEKLKVAVFDLLQAKKKGGVLNADIEKAYDVSPSLIKKITKILKELPEIDVKKKGRANYYVLKGHKTKQTQLF